MPVGRDGTWAAVQAARVVIDGGGRHIDGHPGARLRFDLSRLNCHRRMEGSGRTTIESEKGWAGVTAREETLVALAAVRTRLGRDALMLSDLVGELHRRGSALAESTIRTYVTSRICANGPDNHAVVYRDLERVGRGPHRERLW